MDHMRKKRGERQASWIQSTMRRSPLTDRRVVATGSEEGPKASSNRSTKTICPFRIFRRASATPNQAARSISGKVRRRPERGGHSISKVLLRMSAGSQDRSRLRWPTPERPCRPAVAPRRAARNLPPGRVQSLRRIRAERRIAALHRRQSGLLGMLQAPSSLFCQNGPPG